jgi:processive 1,2-diacylglycerol beta-glucosyltransferase
MSASTGGGHNRAAKAIQEELIKRNVDGEEIECKIVDSLKLVNNTMDKIISRGYEKSALYTPKAYGSVYRISEKSFASKNEYKSNPITSFMAKKFITLLKEYKPDVIIGTHPFPMIALSVLKKNVEQHNSTKNILSDPFHKYYFNLNVPTLVSVLTDYTMHSTYIQNEIDYYIVGHEYVQELLIDEGVDPEKIKTFGIPVEKSFLTHKDRPYVLEKLGLSADKFTVLLMGGSFGAGNIKDTFDELLEVDRDFQIIVVAGRNLSLKQKLQKRYDNSNKTKNVIILGFTNKMNDILASVDVLVTKPGGLTTTEALLKDVPLIVPYYIPGQEEENLEFLMNCGAALHPSKKYTLSILLRTVIDNPSRLDILQTNIRSIRKFNSAQNIAELLVDNLSNDKDKNILETTFDSSFEHDFEGENVEVNREANSGVNATVNAEIDKDNNNINLNFEDNSDNNAEYNNNKSNDI